MPSAVEGVGLLARSNTVLVDHCLHGLPRTMRKGMKMMYERCEVQAGQQQEGEIHSMLSQLDQALESLNDAVNTIQYRLEPVMRSSDPQVAGKEGLQTGPSTPISSRLQMQIHRVQFANNVLRDSITRLEV